MKRYVRASKLTADEITEMFRTKGYLYGMYTTRRGKQYHFLITRYGSIEAREEYTEQKSTGGYCIKERYLHVIPKEMQNYIIEQYGAQLSEMGITLRF